MVGLGVAEKNLKRNDQGNVDVHVLSVIEVGAEVVQDTCAGELDDAVELNEFEGLE